MVQDEEGWIYKDGTLSPSYAVLLARSTLLSKMHETDRVVTFRFASDDVPPVNIHKSHLRFAGGPLAKFAGDDNDFVEQRTESVMLVDDRPEVFSLIRKFLYLQSIRLDDASTSVVTGLCEAANRWCLLKLLGAVLVHLAVIVKGASVDTLVLCAPIISTIPTVTKSQRLCFAERVAERFKDIVKATKAFTTEQGSSEKLDNAKASDAVEDKMQPPPQSVSDATLKSQEIVQDQTQSNSPCIGIWKSFSSNFGMASHMVDNVVSAHTLAKQDILDLFNVVLSHFDEAENRDENLFELLLRHFPWELISIDDVLGANEYCALWSSRSLRVLARAAVAAALHSDERFAFRVKIPYKAVVGRKFVGIVYASPTKARLNRDFKLVVHSVTDSAGVTNLGVNIHMTRPRAIFRVSSMIVRLTTGGCVCCRWYRSEVLMLDVSRDSTSVGSPAFLRHCDLCDWLDNHEEDCCLEINAYVDLK